MTEFLFRTDTCMKPYNHDRFWIDEKCVPEVIITAQDLKEGLAKYVEHVKRKSCIEVSKNAIKTKSPIFRDLESGDPKQVGYVITGCSEFEFDEVHGNFSRQYVDLWVTIYQLTHPTF